MTGIIGGYLAAIGFFRTNSLYGLSLLTSIPVANLLWILVGMPLIAVGPRLAARRPRPGRHRPPATRITPNTIPVSDSYS